ncbi:MAG TPA: DUF6325 family protein [Acidimicrobiia bacterium]
MGDNEATSVGPVEIVVLEFPGSRFNGEIVPALSELVDTGVVAILDLVVLTKDPDGGVEVLELIDMGDEDAAVFDELDGDVIGLLSEDDLVAAGALLEPGSTAAVIVWENTWARRLVGAILDSGGRLVAHDRVDAETVNLALAALDEIEAEIDASGEGE